MLVSVREGRDADRQELASAHERRDKDRQMNAGECTRRERYGHLQLLVGVVDQQLLERVSRESLEAEDVEDANETLPLEVSRRGAADPPQGRVDAIDTESEAVGVDCLGSQGNKHM